MQLNSQVYAFFERLKILTADYTIDYEEYFNRQKVWCVWANSWTSFERNVDNTGHCTNFTAYGNENSIRITTYSSTGHILWYRSSLNFQEGPNFPIPVVHKRDNYNELNTFFLDNRKHSFGQYSKIFYDVKNNTNPEIDSDLVWDSDDEDLWIWPLAIIDETNIQELYLISKDKKNRLFFRRKFLWQEDFDKDGIIGWTWEKLYVIQMLRLRWFDAGSKHNFSDISESNPWVYDWQIDTWACDTSLWFIGYWASIWWPYNTFYLPSGNDDCRVDLYQWAITFPSWNLAIFPIKDPTLARKEIDYQMNPYIKIAVQAGIYLPYLEGRLTPYLKDFSLSTQTIFNIQSNYDS